MTDIAKNNIPARDLMEVILTGIIIWFAGASVCAFFVAALEGNWVCWIAVALMGAASIHEGFRLVSEVRRLIAVAHIVEIDRHLDTLAQIQEALKKS